MEIRSRDLVIATAGHVDHGKSSLVRALTGTDPDRLPEERRREMTIELGFAVLDRPAGGRLAFVDVPGHERFVETMIAGASGIDAALLVVAADDGPMPQTLEHLAILRLLGIDQLVIALTKIDLVDEAWQRLAAETVAELVGPLGFRQPPVIPVSARVGRGLRDLEIALMAMTSSRSGNEPESAAWLPLDRVFRKQGLGTIVAGTLASGTLRLGTSVRIAPSGLRATIRAMERHGQRVDSVAAGQRVALNLAGANLAAIRRGDVLSDQPIGLSRSLDVALDLLDPSPWILRPDRAVRFCIGAASADATLQIVDSGDYPGEPQRIAHVRLSQPIPVRSGDRFVLRRPSPAATLGGGIVLDPQPDARRRDPGRLAELVALAAGNPEPALWHRLEAGPITAGSLVTGLPAAARRSLDRWLKAGTVLTAASVSEAIESLPDDTMVVARTVSVAFNERLVRELTCLHDSAPSAVGLPIADVRGRSGLSPLAFGVFLGIAVREGAVIQQGPHVRLRGHRAHLVGSEQHDGDRLLAALRSARPGLPITAAPLSPAVLDVLERDGQIVRLDNGRLLAGETFDEIGSVILKVIRRAGPVGIGTIRDQTGISRDTAQGVLQRLDRIGVTERDGDLHRTGPSANEWERIRSRRQFHRLGSRLLDTLPTQTGPEARSALFAPSHHVVIASTASRCVSAIAGSLALVEQHGGRIHRLRDHAKPGSADDGPAASVITAARETITSLATMPGQVRLYVPLGESSNRAGEVLDRETIGLARSGTDVWFYHDAAIDGDSADQLIERLGQLRTHGCAFAGSLRIDVSENRDAVIDAIIAEPGLAGLTPGRPTIANLFSGQRRAAGTGQDEERFWQLA